MRRVLWVSTEKLGDAKFAQKDLPGALAAFEDALSIAKERAAEEPDNPEAQRDLSLSLSSVAALERAQRNYSEALKTYDEALGIRRELAERHEGNKR
jgi:tetratricopeptide (TPR) repeat protein